MVGFAPLNPPYMAVGRAVIEQNSELCNLDGMIDREIFKTLLEAKVLVESWRKEYNQVRTHSSLGYRPPAPEAVLLPTLSFQLCDLTGRTASRPSCTRPSETARCRDHERPWRDFSQACSLVSTLARMKVLVGKNA